MAVLDGSHIVYVDRARSLRHGRSEVSARLGRGSRLPAAGTALGKALVAELDGDARRCALTGAGVPANELDKALDELDRISQRSLAVSGQLRVPGQVCVAAVVRSKPGDAVAAVDVAAAKTDYSESQAREHLGPLVRDCARRMSAELGYAPRS
jgi:IclR family pca regulon transcriptional regulator